jgi:hypothetical protein
MEIEDEGVHGDEEAQFVGDGYGQDDLSEPRQSQQQAQQQGMKRASSSGDTSQLKRSTTRTAGGMINTGGGSRPSPSRHVSREVEVAVEEEDYAEEDDDLAFTAMENGRKNKGEGAVGGKKMKACGGNYYLGTLSYSPPPTTRFLVLRLVQGQCQSGRT